MLRRSFLSGITTGLIFPSEVMALSVFQDNHQKDSYEKYSLNGDIDGFIIPRRINGNLIFDINNNNYGAYIEVQALDESFYYSISSRGTNQNGLLKPVRTITRQRIDLFFSLLKRNDKTKLNYFYDKDLTHIDISTDFYDDNNGHTGTNRKSREHRNIHGHDYVSAIIQILLSNNEKSDIKSIDLISKMGKLKKCGLEHSTKNGVDLYSIIHNGDKLSSEITLLIKNNSNLEKMFFDPSGYAPIITSFKKI